MKHRPVITDDLISESFDYESYINYTEKRVSGNIKSGYKKSVSLADYTRLNLHRMKRIYKTTIIKDALINEIKCIKNKWLWVVITEPWCGDAANAVPVIAKITKQNKNIKLRFILRDENPEVMDEYLTNGSRSIPILINLDAENLKEIGIWGPRPQILQDLVTSFKQKNNYLSEELKEKIQLWYANDKTITIQDEFLEKIRLWNSVEKITD